MWVPYNCHKWGSAAYCSSLPHLCDEPRTHEWSLLRIAQICATAVGPVSAHPMSPHIWRFLMSAWYQQRDWKRWEQINIKNDQWKLKSLTHGCLDSEIYWIPSTTDSLNNSKWGSVVFTVLGSEVLFRMSHSYLFSWCTESIQSSLTSAKLSFLKCNLC